MSEKKLAAPVEAVADAPAAEPKKKAAKPAARRCRLRSTLNLATSSSTSPMWSSGQRPITAPPTKSASSPARSTSSPKRVPPTTSSTRSQGNSTCNVSGTSRPMVRALFSGIFPPMTPFEKEAVLPETPAGQPLCFICAVTADTVRCTSGSGSRCNRRGQNRRRRSGPHPPGPSARRTGGSSPAAMR